MIKKILKCQFGPMKELNNKGVALISSYFVLTILFALTVGFTITTIGELKQANIYRDATRAYWLAESGVNRFLQDTSLLDGGNQNYNLGGNTVTLSKDDTDPQERIVTSTGTIGGLTRTIEMRFPANAPSLFNNTFSTGADLLLSGRVARLIALSKTRITGTYTQAPSSLGVFQDKLEGVDSSLTTLKYPDADSNGTADEFTDFVQFNQDLIATYPPEDVVYVQQTDPNATYLVYPSSDLVNKKILYVEGPSAGTGSVDIIFDTTWADNQNLTVITTGDVNFILPLSNPSNESKLNVIAWNNYYQGSVLIGARSGATYAHNEAEFGGALNLSFNWGSLVANDQINFDLDAFVGMLFKWENPIDENGNVPPGFEGLISGGATGYSDTPSQWAEI